MARTWRATASSSLGIRRAPSRIHRHSIPRAAEIDKESIVTRIMTTERLVPIRPFALCPTIPPVLSLTEALRPAAIVNHPDLARIPLAA